MKLLFPFTLNRNSKQSHGLTFWAPGGHGSGNVFDFSGQFDNGFVTVTPPKWVQGVDGGQTALRYDGTVRTNLVTSPNPPAGGITVGCWVKSSTTARYQYLMVQWGVAGGSDNWHMRLDTTTGFVYWNTSTTGSYQAGRDLNGTTNICDGKWHLVVCTYDLVNEKIYVDGVLQATLAATGAIFSPASLNISLGGLSDNSTGTNWLIGDMDEPRIYNYALPQKIITEWFDPKTRWELRYKPKQVVTASRIKVTESHPTYPPTFTAQLGTVQSLAGFLELGITSAFDLNKNVTQSLTLTQSVALTSNRSLSASNSLEIWQQVVKGYDAKLGLPDSKPGFIKLGFQSPAIHVQNSLTITQSVTVGAVLNKSVSNSLVITQSAIQKTPNQHVSQPLTISQTLSRSGSQFAHSASNSLTLLQVADEFKFKPRSVSQSLTITQSATYVKTTGLSNSLTITQSLAYQYAPHLELSTQNLTIAQTLAENAIRPRTVSQSLVVAQTVTKSKIITKTLSQSLAISQNALNSRDTTAHQSLTVAQVVAVAVFRNNPIPTQSLHITQSVHVQLILNRSVTSNLVLLHEHQVPNGQGGFITIPNLLYAKGGPGDNACCPISGGTTYFQAPSRAIILPNPEFGDGEANVGAVKIIRTITGGTFSYVKKSVNRKLKYKFHITQKKAFELRQFLLDFMATRLMMTNWKGEMWNGYFLSDPAEITSITRGEPCIGDLYEVELDFQGIRIN